VLCTVGLLERLTVVNNAPKREFAGTPTFCSVAAHSGEHPAACDDLEAMVWIFAYGILF
jgi:hypothetical protein